MRLVLYVFEFCESGFGFCSGWVRRSGEMVLLFVRWFFVGTVGS